MKSFVPVIIRTTKMAASIMQRCVVGISRRRPPRHLATYYIKRYLNLNFFNKEFHVDKDTLIRMTQPLDLSQQGIDYYRMKREMDKMIQDQTFREERVKALGPDLAAASFVIARGGAAKFVDKDPWVKGTGARLLSLPRKYDPDYKLEGLDCSNVRLLYVGLDNFVNLEHLKYISFSNGEFVDDWFLARLQVYSNTLEFLDISGCSKVTECGVLALHHLRKLKVLKMNDCPFVRNQELIALLLEELMPDLHVLGVDKSTDLLPDSIAISDRLKEDMIDIDFQALQSRFLAMGDILNDGGQVMSTSVGKGNYDPKVDDGLESYIDTFTVEDDEVLETRLAGRRLETR